MSAKSRIRACDLAIAKEAEELFGRRVSKIVRDGVEIHFDDPAQVVANDAHDPLTAWEIKRGYREPARR